MQPRSTAVDARDAVIEAEARAMPRELNLCEHRRRYERPLEELASDLGKPGANGSLFVFHDAKARTIIQIGANNAARGSFQAIRRLSNGDEGPPS